MPRSIFLSVFVLFSFTGCNESKSSEPADDDDIDSGGDSDGDSETVTTSDGDTDTDTDTDADTDTDTDTDIDTHTDADTDTDTDTDTDVDTDSDSDSGSDGVYAHVTAVSLTGDPDNYTFAVTVASADIDCSQYADWWEVLSPAGALIYRRILTHSHTDANGSGNPFTRTGGPVPVAADATVIVRAHMNTVGYSGMAMRGSAGTVFDNAPDIGSDFASDVEGLDPQPDDCAF